MTINPSQESRPADEIVVFSIVRDATCAECGEVLLKGDFLRMEKERPLCLACADLNHLVFLPSGNTALTRRSRKYSTLAAVVVRFSRARGRYERQGLLVESDALNRAEAECETDETKRAQGRAKAALVRASEDEAYVAEFTARIRALYPGCPPKDAAKIAGHACAKFSGRVGRSAGAKEFDPVAIGLAVRAFIRHAHTNYDRLLLSGVERFHARAEVAARIAEVEAEWREAG